MQFSKFSDSLRRKAQNPIFFCISGPNYKKAIKGVNFYCQNDYWEARLYSALVRPIKRRYVKIWFEFES